jgi:ring-1,2-phenylacetyl-CoA epoxidase subunit PaaD
VVSTGLTDPRAARDTTGARIATAWLVLRSIPDPEIPVVSIVDLGIVRDAFVHDGTLTVVLTPTYSGCPATEVIRTDVARALEGAQLAPFAIEYRLAPAWTTDWIGADAKERLRAYGIAPPGMCSERQPIAFVSERRAWQAQRTSVACPRCGSTLTETISVFGSTPCKSQHRCLACREPFERFKPH